MVLNKQAMGTVVTGALIVAISMGIRQAFGIFLQPISHDLGLGREVYSLAMAWQNLVLGLPLMAMVADRLGPRWVVLTGGIIYGLSLALLPVVTVPLELYLILGLLTGIALSCTSYAVVLGAIAQVVPSHRLSSAFGITTAAGSLGMLGIVPGAQTLLSTFGWQLAFGGLAGLVSIIALLALGFPAKARQGAKGVRDHAEADTWLQTLDKARQHSGYWLLTGGFFVCGFHVAFIANHLPAFLADQGVSPMIGATALALIGFANVIGSYLFGVLGDRYRKKFLLSFLYGSRAIVIGVFLALPITNLSALVFGGAIGFLWLATVPLTSGVIAQIFGARYLATLYGIVFLSHQIGSFLGVWLGGRLYDATGSYTGVWLAAIALGCIAAILHLPITDGALPYRHGRRVTESLP